MRVGPSLLVVALLVCPRLALARRPPLAGYFGNTLVSLAPGGADRWHLWLEADGSYILFGAVPAQSGRVAMSAAGAVCLVPAVATGAPMCLALGAEQAGDSWADPAGPRGARLLLLRGHR
jgi:hypothetical protein